MIISKKVKIYLNKRQISFAKRQLDLALALWNIYIETQRDSLLNGHGWVGSYDFERNQYAEIKRIYPYFTEMTSKVRKDMLVRCESWMRKSIKTHGVKNGLYFRSKKSKPIRSFFFVKKGVRMEGPSHLWVPGLYTIKLKETGYISEDDIQYVTSGRINYDRPRDSWYVELCLNVPDDYFSASRPSYNAIKTSGLGIDVGIHMLATIADDHNNRYDIPNRMNDERSKDIIAKIEALQCAINHKIYYNKLALGYDPQNPRIRVRHEDINRIYRTSRIIKLNKRIAVLYKQLTDRRDDIIKKLCSSLVRSNPSFICIENLDILSLTVKRHDHNRSLKRRNSMVGYSLFYTTLANKARSYNISLVEAPVNYPSTQICSCCNHVKMGKSRLTLNDRQFVCDRCGVVIDRDYNAALNILHVGNSIAPVLVDNIDALMR